jgi:restriction endonuclease Mrr
VDLGGSQPIDRVDPRMFLGVAAIRFDDTPCAGYATYRELRLSAPASPSREGLRAGRPRTRGITTKRCRHSAPRELGGCCEGSAAGYRDERGTSTRQAIEQMTFTEAAAEVLRMAGKPLHYKEITELAIEKNLLSHVGKSPEVTMGARLAALLKKEDKSNPIVRVKPGVFALREWDGKKKKRSASASEDEQDDAENGEGTEVNALEVEAQTRADAAAAADDDDDEPLIVSGEDALRADLAASGAELFDDEDDDDQPILSGPSSSNDVARGSAGGGAAAGGGAGAAGDLGPDGGRRRRRRRRRRGGREGGPENGEQRTSTADRPGDRQGGGARDPNAQLIQPHAIVSVDSDSQIDTSRDPLAPAPRPMVRDRQQIMAGGAPTGIDIPSLPPGEADDLSGRDLADATVMILSGFDRTQGPVQTRSVVDALLRRGRLGAETRDTVVASAQLTAALRADNMRRLANGQRPRFRFGMSNQGSRIALTDWSLSSDLVRLELDAIAAIERYREAARRSMLRKLQELPGHALIELVLLGLERVGMTNIKTVRRAGAPGGEAHFSAVHRTGTDEIRTAVVVRKDGREIGRERVSDLRGALHHYGPASAGWLLTTGQVLSGAREESGAPAAPIALFDGIAVCKLLEDNDVGVVRTRLTTAIPDLELFETLRG